MSLLNVVVGQKHYLEEIAYVWIFIQDVRHRVNQFDDQLRDEISWGRFAAKDTIAVDYVDGSFVFSKVEPQAKAA